MSDSGFELAPASRTSKLPMSASRSCARHLSVAAGSRPSASGTTPRAGVGAVATTDDPSLVRNTWTTRWSVSDRARRISPRASSLSSRLLAVDGRIDMDPASSDTFSPGRSRSSISAHNCEPLTPHRASTARKCFFAELKITRNCRRTSSSSRRRADRRATGGFCCGVVRSESRTATFRLVIVLDCGTGTGPVDFSVFAARGTWHSRIERSLPGVLPIRMVRNAPRQVHSITASESCCHARFRVLELQNGHRGGSILYVSMALTMSGKIWLLVLPAKSMPRSIIQVSARINAESGSGDAARSGGADCHGPQ